MQEISTSANYIPLLLQIVVAAAFVIFTIEKMKISNVELSPKETHVSLYR